LGDAYLELISTVLIYQTFPRLPSGQCSQIREQLVRNITLADFFRAYNLSSLAQLPPDLAHSAPGRGRSADKDLRKTQSDMFEAYLAAVIISDEQNGLPRAIEWVKGLWAEAIRGHQKTAPTNSGDQLSPKSRLANAIVVRGIVLRYEDMPGQKQKKDKILGLQLFTVGVYLTGWGETNKLLGFGTAKNKKDAGQKAALQALENKKMLKVYEQKKKAFVEAQDAARAAEDQS
jgi:ribonuclease-3